MRHFIASIGLLASLSGCGASGDGTPSSLAEPTPEDRAVAERELARVTQALGEPTCGTIAADTTLTAPGTAHAPVGVSAYGHPECLDGYIIDVPNVPAGTTFSTGGAIPRWPDPISCLFLYSSSSLWKKSGSTYVRVQEGAVLGQFTNQFGGFCRAWVSFTAAAPGDYRIVGNGGILFVQKLPFELDVTTP